MMGVAFIPAILKIFNRPYSENRKWIKVKAAVVKYERFFSPFKEVKQTSGKHVF